ncbi:MAG: 50S ribosomal protein L21 [Armatimonadetes bacterium]|nr:50S ribosomal protein L21 [Armatimonadota bacterium]
MYAIIETGGKQYTVSQGDKIKVEKLEGKIGDLITLDKVLLVNENSQTKIGAPYLKKAEVSAEILRQDKSKKVIVFKYKPKKRYRIKNGHRQSYTLLKINQIKIKE